MGKQGGSAVSAAGESGGAVASFDDASKMTIRGGDRGTASILGEEGGFTTEDCGLAGSELTCTGVSSGGVASLGLWFVSPMEVDLQAKLLAQENSP